MSPPAGETSSVAEVSIPKPPPAPRPIADKFIWNLMMTNGWVIAGGVFAFIGGIFTVVVLSLTVAIITAFVGIPFLLMGIVFFGGGVAVIICRYQETQKTIDVLRHGQPTDGQIADMQENLNVRINHRHPWMIRYTFQVMGRVYEGNVSTLRRPDFQIRQLLTENQWCKYLKVVDVDLLRKQIIEEMLTSGKSFQEIRQKYLL